MSRRFAIADIHGCHKTFMALLDQIKLSKSDLLYLLGDYIDNGPHSKEVLDTIIGLNTRGYQVKPVRGNHEQMFLWAWDSWPSETSISWLKGWGVEFCESFKIDNPTQIVSEYVDFMMSLPLVVSDDDYVFVHADLDFSKNCPETETTLECALMAREIVLEPSRYISKKVVSGHHIRHIEEIAASLTTGHIFLDNGCGYQGRGEGYGSLIALNLDVMKLFHQENLDIVEYLTDEEIDVIL